MFVLIWAALLLSVRGSNAAEAGSFPGGKEHCIGRACITLSEGEITAQAGLCVVIPCSFTVFGFTPTNMVWYKCEPSKRCGVADIIFQTDNNRVQSAFKGRVSLLEPDVSLKNCSIIINDLTGSDSGSYQFRVTGTKNGRPDGFTFTQRATVSVKGLMQKPTLMIPPLTEGQQTTLTCTALGFCSGSEPKITWTWRGTGDSHITGNITAFNTEDLSAVTQKHSSTLTFNSSAEHHGTEVTCKVSFTGNMTTEEMVTLNVTYVKRPVLMGKTTVKEGDALNLTCSVESFPPSVITWTKLGSSKILQNETMINLQNDTGTATLVIRNVTLEHSGQYICTAKLPNTTMAKHAEVTVTFFPKILSSSACEVQSEVLICACISQGIPLPTIKWPLLKNHTEYSLTTNVSNHTINSTVTLTVKDHSNTVVECVSSNDFVEAKENLTIIINELKQGKKDLLKKLLITVQQPQVFIAFLIGILLSASICCLIRKCHRNKQKSSGNMAETEMVTTQVVPLIDAEKAVESNGTHDQEAAEGGAEAAGQSAPDGNVDPKEAEYSDIDFSLLKRNSPAGAEATKETTETEYAEIKKEKKEERQDDGKEGNEEKEGIIGEDKETQQCMSAEEEEGGEDVAVYSNVNEIMGKI